MKTGSAGHHGCISSTLGSASIPAISYAYIAAMGGEGLTDSTRLAILNANYIKERLSAHFKILYTGSHGRCAHEMIVDCRDFKNSASKSKILPSDLWTTDFMLLPFSFP